ncbi:hypothetical protein CRENBAI_008874 [Crenichthys baileyi]|uniref:Uncharacterized protein n=1 Tax=Crenichthys baileyi TaxID=28760 RepID=A0AAV9RML1_9TELE
MEARASLSPQHGARAGGGGGGSGSPRGTTRACELCPAALPPQQSPRRKKGDKSNVHPPLTVKRLRNPAPLLKFTAATQDGGLRSSSSKESYQRAKCCVASALDQPDYAVVVLVL